MTDEKDEGTVIEKETIEIVDGKIKDNKYELMVLVKRPYMEKADDDLEVVYAGYNPRLFLNGKEVNVRDCAIVSIAMNPVTNIAEYKLVLNGGKKIHDEI